MGKVCKVGFPWNIWKFVLNYYGEFNRYNFSFILNILWSFGQTLYLQPLCSLKKLRQLVLKWDHIEHELLWSRALPGQHSPPLRTWTPKLLLNVGMEHPSGWWLGAWLGSPLKELWSMGCRQTESSCEPCSFGHQKQWSHQWRTSRLSSVWRKQPRGYLTWASSW